MIDHYGHLPETFSPEPGVAVESSPAAVWDNYNL